MASLRPSTLGSNHGTGELMDLDDGNTGKDTGELMDLDPALNDPPGPIEWTLNNENHRSILLRSMLEQQKSMALAVHL